MSDADRQRLGYAREVIHGEHPDKGNSNALYAAYVALIAAGTYGVPASQELFRFIDPQWLAAHVSPALGAAVLVAAALGLLVLAYTLGAVRGPVVPTLPYLDLVVASPIDRAVVLARWWRLSLFGCLVGGTLTGLVIGAGLLVAGSTGPVALAVSVPCGVLLGLLCAGTWLLGQVRSGRHVAGIPAPVRGVGTALRALHISSLREQAASATTTGGALLAGDLRAVRLDVASRTARAPRARTSRLRPSGPVGVVARRDLLGLRRAPGPATAGAVVSLAGVTGLQLSVARADSPSLVVLVCVLACYLGFGFWAEGLRIQADNVGTTPLLGIDHDTEGLAHVIVPAALHATASVVIGAVLVVTDRLPPAAVAWTVLTVGLLGGGHLIAAFRGLPPSAAYGSGGGIAIMIGWFLYPLLVVCIAGTLSTVLASRAHLHTESFILLVALGAVLVAWGRSRVRSLGNAHRL